MIIKRAYLLFSLLLIFSAVSAFALEENPDQPVCPTSQELVECEPGSYPIPAYDENGCNIYVCTASGDQPVCPPFPDLVECEPGSYPIPTYDENDCLNGYMCTGGDQSVCPPFPDLVECEPGSYPIPVYDENDCLNNYECTSSSSEVSDCNRKLWDCMQAATQEYNNCNANTPSENCLENYEDTSGSCYSGYNVCTGASAYEFDLSNFFKLIKNTPALKFIKNNVIDIKIERADGSVEIIGIQLGEERIEALRVGGLEDSSVVVNLHEDTINEILSSEKPADEAVKSLKDKEIKLEGKSFWAKLKLFFLKIALLFT